MSEALRADARRNRVHILEAARELFAERGHEVQMGEIAARAHLGIGSLYRHFPNKRALLTAIVQERFRAMSVTARTAEEIDDAREAFETLLRRYLEAAAADKAFQWAMLGSGLVDSAEIQAEKDDFAAIVSRVIQRAVQAGAVRADLVYADFPVMACGVMSTMYFQPNGNPDYWQRHLSLLLDGV
jgi:AcrR family transcriptional regulator